MFALLNFLQSLLPTPASQRDSDEAYLAESADLHDLERRMRSLEMRGSEADRGFAYGLYPR